MNPEVQTYVQQVVADGFSNFLEQNTSTAKKIIQKCLTSARARAAARKARDLVIRKSALESLTLPGKLADCSERNPERTEIYIVEGESAGGSANKGVTGTSRPSSPCAVRSSTPSVPGWTKSSITTRSKLSSQPWEPALAIPSHLKAYVIIVWSS